MREQAPHATEYISYAIPLFRGKSVLAVISPTKKDITFAFSRGAEFDDEYGLLQGVGKKSKHVKLKDASDVKPAVLPYYIKQALRLDGK